MLSQEERRQMVFKLFTALKESNIFPGYTPVQIKEAAIRAEQRIYEESSSKEAYLRGMGERFGRIERAMSGRGRGRDEHRQKGSYEHGSPHLGRDQGFGHIPGSEFQIPTRQGYFHRQEGGNRMNGVGGFDSSENGMAGLMFAENKQLFGKQTRFAAEGMGAGRRQGESDSVPEFGDQSEGYHMRGRSSSCNIQGPFHGPVSHEMDPEGFSKHGNPMPPRRFQPEAGTSSNGKDFRSALDQGYLHVQNNGQMPGMASHSHEYGVQHPGPGFAYLKYGVGAGESRSKSENLSKSPNPAEMRNPKMIPAADPFQGSGFVLPQHLQQQDREFDPQYQIPGNIGAFPFSNKAGYNGSRGHFTPQGNGMTGHEYPFRMPGIPSFPLPTALDPAGGFGRPNPQDRVANTFPMGSHPMNGGAGWIGPSPAFERASGNPGQGGMKSSPIFFSQQVQQQPYYYNTRGTGPGNPTMVKKKTHLGPDAPAPWMSNSPNSTTCNSYTELSPKPPDWKKGTMHFLHPSMEGETTMNHGESKKNIKSPPWSFNRLGSFLPGNASQLPTDSINPQRRMDNSLWFKDGSLRTKASETSQAEGLGTRNGAYKNEENLECRGNETSVTRQPGPEPSLEANGALNPEDALNLPSEVDAFFRENEMEKVYLSGKELLELRSRLKEGLDVLRRSLKIYGAFREVFPKSELLEKYDIIKGLLGRQEEYLKYGAYFLKARSVDGFIDQIKSLVVDMSYELKSATVDSDDVNYGECLMDAVKAFTERKKKSGAFGLNVINKDE